MPMYVPGLGRCVARRAASRAGLRDSCKHGYHRVLGLDMTDSSHLRTLHGMVLRPHSHAGGSGIQVVSDQQVTPHLPQEDLQTADGDCEEVGGCVSFWEEDFWSNPNYTIRQQLLEQDPGLNQRLISSATTVAQLFNQDAWERHRNPDRYWLYMQRMLHSTVLRRILKPCIVFSFIAAAICSFNAFTPATWPRLGMAIVPHTLLGAAISLLLVFRTSSSYARFVEGRVLWGGLVRYCRDWSRLAAVWFPAGEMRGRAARYVQVLAFVLKSHLRSGRTRSNPADPSAFKDDPTSVGRIHWTSTQIKMTAQLVSNIDKQLSVSQQLYKSKAIIACIGLTRVILRAHADILNGDRIADRAVFKSCVWLAKTSTAAFVTPAPALVESIGHVAVQELLPCCEATELLKQPNKPFYMLCKMTHLVKSVSNSGVPHHVLHMLEHVLSELLAVIGGCDRLLGTPIPLSYTRHTSRSLVLYLATLPLALWPVTGWLAIPAMFCISFIFLGIDEIGVEIEEPFCILPLLPMCKTVVSDVTMAMNTTATSA